ncbi:hypothetical protein [Pseudonocardia sp.]|uniref:hypothetical protein n=1 Tax=Pseudonocardia sp. TaxID=60912 RepID=UPI002632ED2F|nr:hypothetical protein [Pseudonocardia sp.]
MPTSPPLPALPRRLPAAATVLLAAAALVAALLLALLMPGGPATTDDRAEVGEVELVRVTGPGGAAVVVPAQISTGVAGSSIDTVLADELGLPRNDADRVTVTSAYGVQIRDRVPATVQLAGQARSTRLVAVDREPGEPELVIGRSELGGLVVVAGERFLSDPGTAREAPALGALLASSTALDALQVLALIPVAALLVVLLRTVVGLQTLGVAVGVTVLLFVPALGVLASEHPVPVAATAALVAALAGSYRGVRLLDRWATRVA